MVELVPKSVIIRKISTNCSFESLGATRFLRRLPESPESSNLLPRHLRPAETQYPLEARVRSYLAVNCGYCHAGVSGTAPTAWDGRHEITLDQTGLVNGTTSLAGDDMGFDDGSPGRRRLHPDATAARFEAGRNEGSAGFRIFVLFPRD